jgi:pyruvate formate lyase activating enzyme
MDVKTSMSKYRLLVPGQDHVENKVKESIKLLLQTEKQVVFRTTVVPLLVEKEDIIEIAHLIQGAQLYILQQFQPHNTLDKSYEDIKPYPLSWLEEVAEIARLYVGQVRIEGE